MKSLILLLMILLPFQVVKSQTEFVTTQGIDPSNLLRGGNVLPSGEVRNEPSLKYRGELLLRTQKGLELGGTLEVFPAIDYWAWGIRVGKPINVSQLSNIGNLRLVPAVEVQLVERNGLEPVGGNREKATYMNHSWRLTFRLEEIGGSPFGFQLEPALTWRGDKIGIWGPKALAGNYATQLWTGRSLTASIFVNLTYL